MTSWNWNTSPARPFSVTGTLHQFARDDRGATAIEYAMIAAGVGATIASTVYTLGESVSTMLFDEIVAGVEGS